MKEQAAATALSIFSKYLEKQIQSKDLTTISNQKTEEEAKFSEMIRSTGLVGAEITSIMTDVYRKSIEAISAGEEETVKKYFDLFIDRNLPENVAMSIRVAIIKSRSDVEIAKTKGVSYILTALAAGAGAVAAAFVYNKTKPRKWWEK